MSNPTPTLLTRAALIDRVHGAGCGSKRQAREIVNGVLGQIASALRCGETVRLVEFGTFQVKERAAHQCRNIQTGELLAVPARRRVVFKPSPALLAQEAQP